MNRCIIVLLLLTATLLQAQQPALKSPAAFYPFVPGEYFTPHHLLVEYMRYLSLQRPDQVKIIEMGLTHEFRPQILVVITSPKNMAQIGDIAEENRARTRKYDVPFKSSGKFDNIALVWLGMSVHGNEPAGSEASAQVAYELLTQLEAAKWLDQAVVLLDPSQNPDGYSRYSSWHNGVGHQMADADRSSREHQEPWPQGRVSHYYFDLNRDWAWQTQLESQNRTKTYNMWMPHVLADIHEMGVNTPYYFPPAAQPFHEQVTPWQGVFQDSVGHSHARFFDKKGWLYYTREVFDLFYPSYGDTWPTLNGAVGMTYEQGGIGGGTAVKLNNGDTLTLKDRIEHHTATALSTVEVSANNAKALVKAFDEFYLRNITNPSGKYKTFVLRTSKLDVQLEIGRILTANRIEFYTAVTPQTGLNGYDYERNTNTPFDIQAGDMIVSAYQSASVMAQVLLEPRSLLVDSLTYDITAWSLPYLFGISAWALPNKLPARADAGERPSLPPLERMLISEKAYAYFLPAGSLQQAKFAAAALQKGLRLSYNTAPTTFKGQLFSQGSLIAAKGDNRHLGDQFGAIVTQLAYQLGVELTPVFTGFADKGLDLGSDQISPILAPKIAVAFGDAVDNNAYGAVWFFLEKELQQPFSAVSADALGSMDLSKYTHLVLPEIGNGYDLNGETKSHLQDWIRAGGRLILLGSANESFIGASGFGLSTKPKVDVPEEQKVKMRHAHFCDLQRQSISNNIPGALISTEFDASHPFMGGIDNFYTLKLSSTAYAFNDNATPIIYVPQNPVINGFVGHNIKAGLLDSPVLSLQNMGRGSVVYFADSPLFRCFWYQGKVLFSNALYK